MKINSTNEICESLKSHPIYGKIYCDVQNLPAAYSRDGEVKVIILGTDPSNPQKKHFKKAFGLEEENSPYFRMVRKNLDEIDLSLKDVYVQNLCKNYFKCVTNENPYWSEVAKMWLPLIKEEFDSKFDLKVPVFITAGRLYFLLTGKKEIKGYQFKRLYNEMIFVKPSENAFNRTLVPFFRHPYYSLKKWKDYANQVKTSLVNR